MKDGKYEVGDIIAFRVKRGSGQQFKATFKNPALICPGDANESMQSSLSWGGGGTATMILERIDGATVMDPKDPLKGWTWAKWDGRSRLPDGAVALCGGNTDSYRDWSNGGKLVLASEMIIAERPILIPPTSGGPCPELRAKIEAMERDLKAKSDELAQLRKQALG